MNMNPAMIEQLQAIVLMAETAGHGLKRSIYEQEAEKMGLSVNTLYKKIKQVVMTKTRKKRADAGDTCLSIDELKLVAGYLTCSNRNQGKQLATIGTALEVLRADDAAFACRLNEATGELTPVSESAVSRALYQKGLHPEQLSQPAPKVPQKSPHPNYLWQIDPSMCVLYYLPKGVTIQVMPESEFYKNKPQNLKRIENDRVWRYVITDHASSWIYVHYVLGAESAKNLTEAFIAATQKRHIHDPVHGLPFAVMVDPGSANTSAVFKNLCRLLGVTLHVNKPGQPWAKGQVEKANDIVERNFEHRLKMMPNPPRSVEELNKLAWQWMRAYNFTAILRRTQATRYHTWLMITPEQLRIAPPAQVMRELAVSQAVPRKVTPLLRIPFNGQEFCVKDIPGVMVGEFLMVARNPWRGEDSAQVLYTNEDGREVIQQVEAVTYDKFGFPEDARTVGVEYRGVPDTLADTNRKAVNRLVMNAATDEEAEKAQKAKATPFGGRLDPMKPITDTPLAEFIPKRGTEFDGVLPELETPMLNLVQVAKALKNRLGDRWQPAHMAWLTQRYPDGAQEGDIAAIAEQLQRSGASTLKVVGGE